MLPRVARDDDERWRVGGRGREESVAMGKRAREETKELGHGWVVGPDAWAIEREPVSH